MAENDVARSEGVGCYAHFDEHEECEQGDGDAAANYGDGIGPGNVAAAIEAEEERGDGYDEDEGADEIDFADFFEPVGVVGFGKLEDEIDYNDSHQTNGELTPEYPSHRQHESHLNQRIEVAADSPTPTNRV